MRTRLRSAPPAASAAAGTARTRRWRDSPSSALRRSPACLRSSCARCRTPSRRPLAAPGGSTRRSSRFGPRCRPSSRSSNVPELPAPLPPGERTVGQLVAETIRAYGNNFWRALPLGLPLAASTQLSLGHDANVQTVILFAFSPLIGLAYVWAGRLVHGLRPTAVAYLAAVLIFFPVSFLARLIVLPALGWLALFGL